MRSFFLSLVLLLSFSMSASGQTNPMDDGVATCGVPVCGLTDTMTALRGLNGDQRGMYALNMKSKYKDATDKNVLENLYNAGKAMKTLFAELKDEDWVQRAAADLVNTAVFNLAKFGDVNGKKMIGYYKEFGTQTFRYNLIAHWQSTLVKIEDVSVLNELVVFASGARDHSISINDEEWVPRAASALISEITMKLTNLDPAHEGLYSVALDEASLATGVLPFDRIAVLDSSSSKNLVVSFINTRLRVIVYTYSNAEIAGNKVSGLYLSNGEMANRFSFELNRMTGEVSGVVESIIHDRLVFAGKQLFSTRSVFAGKAPRELTQKDILGTFNGELAGVKGKLTIRSFRENVYSAVFTSATGSLIINFQGKFFPKNGVISLTSGDKIKLTLSLRETANGAAWVGASFSTTTGTHSNASFAPLN